MKRKFSALLFLIIFVFSGCSSGKITTFTLPRETMPTNFDPQIASNPEDLLVIANIFDGLFEKRNGEIVYNLAESCDISPDGRTYTIKIKQGSVYHAKSSKSEFEGKAVTADDFVFALQRVVNPKMHSPYASDFSNIKNAQSIINGGDVNSLGVYAKDRHTVVIQLENSDYNFIEKLCLTAAYPCNKEFFESSGGTYGLSADKILGNGPFKLSYIDDAAATLVRVDDDKTYLQRIRIEKVSSDELAGSYENEDISCYYSLSEVKNPASGTSVTEFDSIVNALVFNANKTELNNENIRKALGWYAYGFENSGANPQAVSPAYSIFPGTTVLNGSLINTQYTVQKRGYLSAEPKELFQTGLSETGLGKIENLTVLVPGDSAYSIIYENINQLWQKNLGVFFKIEYLPSNQIKARVSRGDFDIAFLPLSGENDTPYGILDIFTPYSGRVANSVALAKADSTNLSLNYIIDSENTIINSALAVPMGSDKTTLVYRSSFSDIYADPYTGVINLKTAKAK